MSVPYALMKNTLAYKLKFLVEKIKGDFLP